MPGYYVNDHAQSNGDHEVHVESCSFLKAAKSTTYLGQFTNCQDAVNAAKKKYPQSDGCYYCSPACHHS